MRRRSLRVLLLGLFVSLTGAATATAQTASPPPGRIEVSIGGGLVGGASLGEQAADERAGGTGGPFRLFDSETELASSGSLEARVGVALTRRYALEAHAAVSRPELRTSVSADSESAPAVTLVERIDQYALGGGILVRWDEGRVFGLGPFASAGAGYLRQVHEEQTLVEEGRFYYAGGGVTRWLHAGGQGFVRAAGLRVDARLYFFSGGASFGDGLRRQGALSGSVVVVF